MKFVKDFKYIVALIAAITFLLITMFITIRQVKRLPLSYIIQILDNQGERIILLDLRLDFRKYEVAESYAGFYREMYRQQQYKFRVIGLRKEDVKTKNTFLGMVFDLYECMWCSVAEAEKQFNTNCRKSFEQATFESKDLDMQNKINKVLHSMKKNIAELVADGIEYPMILTGICYMRQAYRRVILEDGFDGEKIAPEKRNQLLFLIVMDDYSRVASTNGMKVTKVTGKTHFELILTVKMVFW